MPSYHNNTIVPDTASTENKKTQVRAMFDRIAPQYDLLNHLLSLGIDKSWRKKAISEIKNVNHKTILDIATGTGDLAIAAAMLSPNKIIGVDIATQMLDVGRKKISTRKLDNLIELRTGDSELLVFDTNSFDVVMCAYGVRNFEHLTTGLQEMHRVLNNGGKLVILEFSRPEAFPFKQSYHFYFRAILPVIGKLFSKHKTAYSYLPESVMAFPQGNEFCKILSECGFKDPTAKPLTFGVTTLYTAYK